MLYHGHTALADEHSFEKMERSYSTSSSKSDASELSSPDSQGKECTPGSLLPPCRVEEGEDGLVDMKRRVRGRRSVIEQHLGSRLQILRDALTRYVCHRNKVKNLYENISGVVNEIINVLGEQNLLAETLSDIDFKLVEDFVKNDPVILVSGQVNCGKSSLINEILERTVVQANETPCTAMITKLKFSRDEYYQMFNSDGTPRTTREDFDRKRLQKEMHVQHSERKGDKVHGTVEVGLNNPVLACGIQIYDTPGRNENEALDAAVHDALNGVSQVLIYVLDANQSFRLEDERFLQSVLAEYPQLHILFVCNKCDDLKKARAMDAPSDEEEAVWVRMDQLPKGEETYQRLCRFKYISKDSYFQISCKDVSKARRTGRSGACMDEFLRLINSLIDRFECCVYEHLHRALDSLYASATLTFDHFVSEMYLHQRIWEKLHRKLVAFSQLEDQAQSQIEAMIEEQQVELQQLLKNICSERKAFIIEKIQNGVGSHEATSHRKLIQIAQLVMFEAIVNHTNDFDEIVTGIERKLFKKMNELLTDCDRESGVGDLIPQMRNCFHLEVSASMVYTKISKKSLMTSLKDSFAKLLCTITKNERLRESLIKQVVARLVRGIDEKTLAGEVVRQLTAQFRQSHDRFINLVETIKKTYSTRKSNQKDLRRFIKPLSLGICQLQALQNLVRHGEIRVVAGYRELMKGHRSEVYTFGYAAQQYAVKRLVHGPNYEENLSELCVMLNSGRLLQMKHPHLLSSFDILTDSCGYLVVKVPHCQLNLFRGLVQEMHLSLKDRMLMVRNIADACVYLADRQFRATDLRPNNILLDRWQPKINLTKWKCLDTPYPEPDNKPPFHFAPEVITNVIPSANNAQDTFSCVILLWFLAIGRFIRPDFAQTDSLEAIYLSDLCQVREELMHHLEDSRDLPEAEAVFVSIRRLLQQNIDKSHRRMTIWKLRDAMDTLCNSF